MTCNLIKTTDDKKIHMIEAVFRESWISIKANKLRSFLTTLGIIIGVCAVVIMVAAGQTVQNMINESLEGMGSNLLIIRPEFVATSGVKGSGQTVVKTNDADVVKKIKHIIAVSPMINGAAQLVYGNENYAGSIVATTPDYLSTGNWEIEKGSMFTDRDVKSASSYIVIGKKSWSGYAASYDDEMMKQIKRNYSTTKIP